MTYSSRPHNASPIADELQWRRAARLWVPNGVALGDRNEMAPTASTGLTVMVDTGTAYVEGFALDVAAAEYVTLADADPTDPRIDLIVTRYTPPSGETDGAVTLDVLTGTPAASPSAPALTTDPTGVYEVAVAEVTVPANAASLSPSDVLDIRARVATPAIVDLDGELPPYFYPFGLSVAYTSGVANWPGVGRVLTMRPDRNNATQLLITTAGVTYHRYASSDGAWQLWQTDVRIVEGTYTGDGTFDRLIYVGSGLRFAIVSSDPVGVYAFSGLPAGAGGAFIRSDGTADHASNKYYVPQITDDAYLEVSGSSVQTYMNSTGNTYTFLALVGGVLV